MVQKQLRHDSEVHMFTLTMTLWFLAHGVGDPVKGPSLKHNDTFTSHGECMAKGEEDKSKLAEMFQKMLEEKGDHDTVSRLEVGCKIAGQEI